MEILTFKNRIGNGNLLLLILGMLMVPVVNSATSLVAFFFGWIFDLSFEPRIWMSLMVEFSVVLVFVILFVLVQGNRARSGRPLLLLTIKTVVILVIVFAIILISGRLAVAQQLVSNDQEIRAMEEQGCMTC